MSESADTRPVWAVLPAAGTGRRCGGSLAKQHQPLAGLSALERCLSVLLAEPRVAGAVVALAPHDLWRPASHSDTGKPVHHCQGGSERPHSVLKAIEHLLSKGAAEGDWALVHDAARPLLRSQDLKTLIERAQHDPVGGLLAVPVRDTLKVAGADDRIARTLPREHLWHAQTPQMFGLGRLQRALVQALAAGIQVTDEASAMEWAGECPLLVPGHTDNFKISGPEDMGLADQIIRAREASKT